ncbi:hypothetical protein LSS_17025 [Leptospira santarosai serovar Shermani str. LT 821]|uniref:Uncharacterized protein n=1 Tax=Leptospira santarosai serovar Shermani str. LT 821 TaxID=758847 RepID=K8Y751_9LEPT|nr:hypothetical protein LSS_17025 [Leptospira santarosai serovar Shermani str. LT 821]
MDSRKKSFPKDSFYKVGKYKLLFPQIVFRGF